MRTKVVLFALFILCTGISCTGVVPIENCLLWNYHIIKEIDKEYYIFRVEEDELGFTSEFQSAFDVPGRGGEFTVPTVWIKNIRYVSSPLNANFNDLYIDWNRFYTSGKSTTKRAARCVRQANLGLFFI